MIEKFEDLDLESVETLEQAEEKLKEKLGVSFEQLKQALSDYTVAHAEELTHEFVNIAPLGDYSKVLDNNDGMAEFLKTEAHKIEHWHIQGLTASDVRKDLISFHFANDAVDDGDSFQGFVYVSFQGKIKHAFTQGNDN